MTALYANLAIASAVVVYLLALAAHAAEWAAARTSATVPARVEDDVLVPAGGAVAVPVPPAETVPPINSAAGLQRELVGRIAVALTVIAFGLNLAGVVLRGVAAARAPWGNMTEFLTAAAVMIVGTYLVLLWRRGTFWLGLPVAFLAALTNGLAITVFYVPVAPLVPALDSVWFIIHIVAAAIAGAAFNVGGLLSLLYLLRARAERRRQTRGYLTLLPPARTIDQLAYKCHAFAFPLWTFAVAAGAVWAEYAWGRYWGWDPKEIWALVTWVAYACYLHARATAGWRGRRAAIIALVGLGTFWFNFVGVNLLFSGLHSYAGI